MKHRLRLLSLVALAVAAMLAGCGDAEKTKQLEADLTQAKQEAAELETRLAEVQGTHEKALAGLQAATDERDALAKQIETYKAEATVMKAELDKAAADMQAMLALKDHAEKLAADHQKATAALDAAASKLQEQAKQITSLNELVTTLRGTIADLEAKLKGLVAPATPAMPGVGG